MSADPNLYADEGIQQQREDDATSDQQVAVASQDPHAEAVAATAESFHTRNFICFVLLGLINNYMYCVVLSGAENIADGFHLRNLMALVSWSVIAGGIFIRNLNAFLWIGWSTNKRILCAGAQGLFGIVVVCVAPYCGTSSGFRFFLMLVGILFIGTSSSQGEQSFLAYMQAFPARTVGAWSSGTGASGVLGSLIYLGLSNAGLTESSIFAIQLPLFAVYWGIFYFYVVEVRPSEVTVTSGGSTRFEITRNWFRNWWEDETELHRANVAAAAAAASPTTASAAAATSASTSSGSGGSGSTQKSSLSMQEFKNKSNTKSSEEEKSPLLNTAAGDAAFDSNHSNNNNEEADDDGITEEELTLYDRQDDWSSFRRFVFGIAPSFPYEAIKRCNRLILFQGLNLMLVYLFEYAIQFVAPNVFPDMRKVPSSSSSGGNISSRNTTTDSIVSQCSKHLTKSDFDFFTANAFVISQFCYQIGVLVSRSSLSFITIKRFEILTIIQFVNFICWIVLSKTAWLMDVCDPKAQAAYTWIFLVWMVFVGLMGGASYVQIFFAILNDAHLSTSLAAIAKLELKKQHAWQKKAEEAAAAGVEGGENNEAVKNHVMDNLNSRELAMNVGALYQTAGITLGSVVDLLLDNTLLKK